MLLLNPPHLLIDGVRHHNILAVSIDRQASRMAAEWRDDGPHCVYADVPEQRVMVTLRRRLDVDELADPVPGAESRIVVFCARGAGDAGRTKVTVDCVLLSVRTDLDPRPDAPGATAGAIRTLTFIGVGKNGATHPVSIDAAGDGEE